VRARALEPAPRPRLQVKATLLPPGLCVCKFQSPLGSGRFLHCNQSSMPHPRAAGAPCFHQQHPGHYATWGAHEGHPLPTRGNKQPLKRNSFRAPHGSPHRL